MTIIMVSNHFLTQLHISTFSISTQYSFLDFFWECFGSKIAQSPNPSHPQNSGAWLTRSFDHDTKKHPPKDLDEKRPIPPTFLWPILEYPAWKRADWSNYVQSWQKVRVSNQICQPDFYGIHICARFIISQDLNPQKIALFHGSIPINHHFSWPMPMVSVPRDTIVRRDPM